MENTISHFPTESKAVIYWLQVETVLWGGSQPLLEKKMHINVCVWQKNVILLINKVEKQYITVIL